MADGLARLADNSLAVARPGSETRYRVLETIRQYGVDQLEQVGELEEVRARQVRWCLATAEELVERADEDVEDYVQGRGGDGAWRGAFDLVADDLRAGFAWAVSRPELRADAHRLALLLAPLTFLRGLPAEAQRRFEEAATLTDDPAARVTALNDAAGAAMCRHVGNDTFRLWRRAADIAAESGDGVTAAHNLALAATLINRGPGIMAEVPPPEVVEELIQEAVALAGGFAPRRAVDPHRAGVQRRRARSRSRRSWPSGRSRWPGESATPTTRVRRSTSCRPFTWRGATSLRRWPPCVPGSRSWDASRSDRTTAWSSPTATPWRPRSA